MQVFNFKLQNIRYCRRLFLLRQNRLYNLRQSRLFNLRQSRLFNMRQSRLYYLRQSPIVQFAANIQLFVCFRSNEIPQKVIVANFLSPANTFAIVEYNRKLFIANPFHHFFPRWFFPVHQNPHPVNFGSKDRYEYKCNVQ